MKYMQEVTPYELQVPAALALIQAERLGEVLQFLTGELTLNGFLRSFETKTDVPPEANLHPFPESSCSTS